MVVMDNPSSHKSSTVVDARAWLLPPYSSDLNPSEMQWSCPKRATGVEPATFSLEG